MNAGRYGLACGEVCVTAQEMGIAAICGMYAENPGVLEFRRRVLIVPTGETPADMAKHLQTMARLGIKLARGEDPGPADEAGYIPRGIRKLGLRDKPAANRVGDMLSARLHDRPFKTELPIEMPDQVAPAAPVTSIGGALLALVTTGGLVPRGNPDKLVRGGATTYFKYSIDGLESMTPDRWECIHRGFFTDIVNQNPNYILPLNLIRELERRSEVGSVHGTYFSTSGVGTAVADSKRMGAQIAREMKEAGVQACVMVAT
jgi:glycine reductase